MTRPKPGETPANPQSGEPEPQRRGPDVWPFEVPETQRERIPVEPVGDERERGERPAPD